STVRGTEASGVVAVVQGAASPGSAVVDSRRSIIAGHGVDLATQGGGVHVSGGYNVVGDASGAPATTGDLKSTDPLLGPLGFHGGEPPVFDPKPASPAKDAIPTAACGPALDQRGFPRPFGSACDAGAAERTIGGDVNGDGGVTVADVFTLINYL